MRLGELITRIVLALSIGITALVLAHKVGGWTLVGAFMLYELARNVGNPSKASVMLSPPKKEEKDGNQTKT